MIFTTPVSALEFLKPAEAGVIVHGILRINLTNAAASSRCCSGFIILVYLSF